MKPVSAAERHQSKSNSVPDTATLIRTATRVSDATADQQLQDGAAAPPATGDSDGAGTADAATPSPGAAANSGKQVPEVAPPLDEVDNLDQSLAPAANELPQQIPDDTWQAQQLLNR